MGILVSTWAYLMSAFTPTVFRSWKLAAGRVPCYFILCLLLLESTPQTRNVVMGYLLDGQPRKLGLPSGVVQRVHNSSHNLSTTMLPPLLGIPVVTQYPWYPESAEYRHIVGNMVQVSLSPGYTSHFLFNKVSWGNKKVPLVLEMWKYLKGIDYAVAVSYKSYRGHEWRIIDDFTMFKMGPSTSNDYLFLLNPNGTRGRLTQMQMRNVREAAFKAKDALETEALPTQSSMYYIDSAKNILPVIFGLSVAAISICIFIFGWIFVVKFRQYRKGKKFPKDRKMHGKHATKGAPEYVRVAELAGVTPEGEIP
eukprot:GHVS01024320.1.p1 GENE.GHVS01024320.1~~GHVS01024320.1.p1  ORF type:complete len:343 (+),score=19.85 GHVS01024320.1:103-1029(+)